METKKILGLDLGVTSIGWAIIEEEGSKKRILGMGSRIVPLGTDEKTEFSTGNKISKNQSRTAKRTQRKGYDRYQQRRANLTKVLLANNMFDEQLFKLAALELWSLRSKAVQERISLTELGRVLYHLNQKRGYKSSRTDANLDKKDTEYVATVKGRHQELKDSGLTIGQKFYQGLLSNEYYRIKEQVFPREAYIEEYDAIMIQQSKHYPNLLTQDLVSKIRNEIIYYQRPLKSQKGLVTICEMAGFETKDKSGKIVFVGPKVIPKSSPLFQLCKIWETVNNLNLKVKNTEISKYKWLDWKPNLDQKKAIIAYLNENERLSFTDLLKIVGLKKEDVYANKQIINGLQGNTTLASLKKIVDGVYLQFELEINTKEEAKPLFDKKTGEVLCEELDYEVTASFEREPLYKLWHIIYSIKDEDLCQQALTEKFGFNKDIASSLAKIDFTRFGFGNKSSKAIRKILPYLMRGHIYSDACQFAGYNHSNSFTKEELLKKVVAEKLELLPKNILRQPVVEKILNQSINIVNAIIDHYGKPDEIRIELARELKQSKDERNDAEQRNKANERLNSEISHRLAELGLPSTKRYIQKYKFIFPSQSRNLKDAHVENTCIYCGKAFSIAEALTGDNFDVDHIVPKSLLFDDSQTNKVLVHRSCNAAKTNQTAYDFIAKKGEAELNAYIERVDEWFKRGILSYSKMQRLKVSYEEYLERKSRKKQTEADIKLWESFIDRQLRETQYIARKAREIFEKICHQVTTTEGSVTAELRRLWGWDDVLMNLQLPKYRALGLTRVKEWKSDHGRKTHQKEEIIGWTKRDDHRHHAIDALVVACTKQGYIQRINTFNSSDVKDAMRKEIIEAAIIYDEKRNLLEQYLIKERPFHTAEVEEQASKIMVSFKSGKKVATKGTRKIKVNGVKQVVQKDIIIPRGALSEESVYGKIKTIEKNKPIKYLFENANRI
ncbi:MAG TPA: type II CRISPR RNA-guided endonuclease Cas9, partial [Chitinophagaceae bacterium]|nr:type II CRISPR RNA-guided endonuclease Cas9 [Chitinophagaceae bacterium]